MNNKINKKEKEQYKELLEDASHWMDDLILSPEEFDKILDIIANPPKPTEGLIRALRRKR